MVGSLLPDTVHGILARALQHAERGYTHAPVPSSLGSKGRLNTSRQVEQDEEVVAEKPPESYESVNHSMTYNLQPETMELLREFRHVLNEYSGQRSVDV